jgi:hypothetical protein
MVSAQWEEALSPFSSNPALFKDGFTACVLNGLDFMVPLKGWVGVRVRVRVRVRINPHTPRLLHTGVISDCSFSVRVFIFVKLRLSYRKTRAFAIPSRCG